jgi:hypothetical protein
MPFAAAAEVAQLVELDDHEEAGGEEEEGRSPPCPLLEAVSAGSFGRCCLLELEST